MTHILKPAVEGLQVTQGEHLAQMKDLIQSKHVGFLNIVEEALQYHARLVEELRHRDRCGE